MKNISGTSAPDVSVLWKPRICLPSFMFSDKLKFTKYFGKISNSEVLKNLFKFSLSPGRKHDFSSSHRDTCFSLDTGET